MRRLAVTAVVLSLGCAGCGAPEEPHGTRTAPPQAAPAVQTEAPIGRGVTHGGWITTVAVTEKGDAALTVDDLDEIRLWPSLDGRRPPVPVTGVNIVDLALGHADRDLLAAVLDGGGNVQLVRFGLDGSVHGRAQLPDDSPCYAVVAVDNGVLVARADQSIERYDADGKRRGRVVVDSRHRVTAIAARRGGAVALIEPDIRDPSLVTTARMIEIDGGLRWGASTTLPEITERIALSPDHRRIAVAVITEDAKTVQVIDRATGAKVGKTMEINSTDVDIGFTDDEHVAVLSNNAQWWHGNDDPTVRNVSSSSHFRGGAVGDRFGVAGDFGSLALIEPDRVR